MKKIDNPIFKYKVVDTLIIGTPTGYKNTVLYNNLILIFDDVLVRNCSNVLIKHNFIIFRFYLKPFYTIKTCYRFFRGELF